MQIVKNGEIPERALWVPARHEASLSWTEDRVIKGLLTDTFFLDPC